MSDDAKPRSWWNTLPGILTGAAAVVTALAGLLAAVNQAGWFRRPEAAPAATAVAAAPAAAAGTRESSATVAATTQNKPPATESTRAHAVALPAQRDYKLGPATSKATYTLLEAEVVPQTTERNELRIHVRMTNHDRYDKNFWDSSFRLLVDGVPIAPESGLNELVASQSAKEGDVLFPVARGTRSATLRIEHGEDATEIPLALGP